MSVAIAHNAGDYDPNECLSLTPVEIDPSSAVYEIHRPEDWHQLCVSHPALREEMAPLAGTELVPDWSSVATRYDGVHLSLGGFLCTTWRRLRSPAGVTTLWTWEHEGSLWLRDVLNPRTAEVFHPDAHEGPDIRQA